MKCYKKIIIENLKTTLDNQQPKMPLCAKIVGYTATREHNAHTISHTLQLRLSLQ